MHTRQHSCNYYIHCILIHCINNNAPLYQQMHTASNHQYWISKLRHLISAWILKHLSWQMRSPHRGQLDRERLPQMEQYLREGYLGRPTRMLQKLGSVFSSSPSSWMILRRLRLRLRWLSFLARLLTRFSFLCLRGSPSPTSNPSSSSNSAILLGSSKKSSSRQRSFSSMTALRLFSSTFRTAAENLLLRPPWRVLGIALDIYLQSDHNHNHMHIICCLALALVLPALVGKMIIQSPPELAAFFVQKYGEAGIPYGIANYGVVPYGKVVSGEVGTPQFLEDCRYQQLPQKSKKSILLVQRNDCTFTQKSINVQKQGGKLAIIIDNVVEQSEKIVMKDDGKGHFVNIPTILIGRQDGLKILDYINQNPILMVSFDLKVTPRSDVTLWVDILDHKNYIFLRNFQSYFARISTDIDFHIAYPTSRCSDNCNQNNCFYDGKYCRYPIGFGGVENGGKEVIREQLRQYNVFQEDPNKWWDYMLGFDERCNDLAIFNECSQKVLSNIDLNPSSVSAKVDSSFQAEDNDILRNFSEQKYNNSILYYPSIVINSIIYRGNLEPYEVFETICSSMTPTPAGCSDDPSNETTHLTAWIIVGVVSVVAFALFLLFCFRRIARRQLSTEMNKKVNELVNEYISMYEVEKFKQGEVELKNKP